MAKERKPKNRFSVFTVEERLGIALALSNRITTLKRTAPFNSLAQGQLTLMTKLRDEIEETFTPQPIKPCQAKAKP